MLYLGVARINLKIKNYLSIKFSHCEVKKAFMRFSN